MRRTDQAYWQRLRRDKRSGISAALTVFAWVPSVVTIGMLIAPGGQNEARNNPLYWLVMLPLAWWASRLVSYEPGPVRLIRPAQAGAPLVAIVTAVVAAALGEDAAPYAAAAAVSLVAAAIAWLLFTGSMLQTEGPAR